jgi:hypothetical protein
VGDKLADLLTREDVRDVVKKSREKRAYQGKTRSRIKGGTEAARTVLSVLRQMIGWGIDEEKLKRTDNPASNMEKNLPKKKKGERCLSLRERRGTRSGGDSEMGANQSSSFVRPLYLQRDGWGAALGRLVQGSGQNEGCDFCEHRCIP